MSESIRVLVVDDDFAVARLHERYVSEVDGFVVVGTALTAASAAEQLAGRGVDLLLLDTFLPDASGIELLRRLRAASTAPLDVMMVTAAPEPDLVRQAFALGVVDYVLKPFQQEDFRARLLRYARRRAESASMRSSTLTQEQIDAIQGRTAPPRRADLPKGLSDATARLVAAALRERTDAVTASEVGDALGMSRVSARRYLEYFVSRRLVDVTPRYGETGRPQNLYRWIGGAEL